MRERGRKVLPKKKLQNILSGEQKRWGKVRMGFPFRISICIRGAGGPVEGGRHLTRHRGAQF